MCLEKLAEYSTLFVLSSSVSTKFSYGSGSMEDQIAKLIEISQICLFCRHGKLMSSPLPNTASVVRALKPLEVAVPSIL
jgi:hypothetical protein